MKKANVKVKIALSGDEKLIKDIEVKFGIKVKKTQIDSKFFIVDRKEVLFYLSKGGNEAEDIAVWLNSEFFVESLASLFELAVGEKEK